MAFSESALMISLGWDPMLGSQSSHNIECILELCNSFPRVILAFKTFLLKSLDVSMFDEMSNRLKKLELSFVLCEPQAKTSLLYGEDDIDQISELPLSNENTAS